MPKKTLYCDGCENEFVVTHKSGDETKYCVFCGTELILDWNSDETDED